MDHDRYTARRCLASLLAVLAMAAAGAELSHTVGDTAIHLGVVPVESAVRQDPAHAEQILHGARGGGNGVRHVVVAVFDASSGRISDANVRAFVTEPGLYTQSKPLLRMTVGDVVTYGNTFRMDPGTRYVIRIVVRRADRHVPVEARFDYVRPPD